MTWESISIRKYSSFIKCLRTRLFTDCKSDRFVKTFVTCRMKSRTKHPVCGVCCMKYFMSNCWVWQSINILPWSLLLRSRQELWCSVGFGLGCIFLLFIAKLLTGKCLVWVLLCSFISGHAGVFGTRLEQNNRNTYQKDWETDTVVLSGCHGGGFLTSLD